MAKTKFLKSIEEIEEVLQYRYDKLSSEELDYYAKKAPYTALKYAGDKLFPETIDYCAKKAPNLAICYLLNKLSSETLNYCASKIWGYIIIGSDGLYLRGCEKSKLPQKVIDLYAEQIPETALRRASKYISPEVIDLCSKQVPETALAYASNKLSNKLINEYAKEYPETALKYASQYLSPEILNFCIKQEPETALKYVSDKLSNKLIDEYAKEYPETALKYASQYLSLEVLDFCAKQEPRITLKYIISTKLPKETLLFCIGEYPETALMLAYNKRKKKETIFHYSKKEVEDILEKYHIVAKDKKIFLTEEEQKLIQFHQSLKLQIELVPNSCWWSNVRSHVKASQWDKIRKNVYEKANYLCEICGEQGKEHPVECHEIWQYNDGIQKLSHFVAICQLCHQVKHIGLSGINGVGERAFHRFKKVNHLEHKLARKIEKAVWKQWKIRNKQQWQLNIDYLFKEYNIETNKKAR